MNADQIPVPGFRDSKRDAAFAWLSLLLYSVSFGAAFFVGEGLATWLFGWPETPDPGLWEMLAVAVPALIVFALPAVPAWYFGMRAHRKGSRSGRVAAWVAVSIAAAFVVVNSLSFLLG
jgi:hypothetical protein